jgi:hypothetical protein
VLSGTPFTTSGDQTHNVERSVQHLIFSRTNPRNQRHNSTRHVDQKTAKELSSLVRPFLYPSLVFVSILINLVPRRSQASLAISRHSGATRIMAKIHLASSKVPFVFFSKNLEVRGDCTSRSTKVLKAATFGRTDKHKEKSKQETTISRLCETFIHLDSTVI